MGLIVKLFTLLSVLCVVSYAVPISETNVNEPQADLLSVESSPNADASDTSSDDIELTRAKRHRGKKSEDASSHA
jgi:hypothetical protein